jgi:hypothetical protein
LLSRPACTRRRGARHFVIIAVNVDVNRRAVLFIAPEHQQFAEMLHAFATHLLANLVHERDALFAIVWGNAHFDQRMGRERDIDLVQHRCRQAFLTDHHNGIKVMCGSAKRATCARGEVWGNGHVEILSC